MMKNLRLKSRKLQNLTILAGAMLTVGFVAPMAVQAQSTSATLPSDVAPLAADVHPLKVGDKAPGVDVSKADGTKVNLSDIYTSAPTVLIFYRGGWCPFCNRHLASLATIQDDLTSAGYQIVAISPDTPNYIGETANKDKVDYTLLSDASATAIRAFGLAFRLDDQTFNRYRTFTNPIDIEARSGNKNHILPVPAAYIIDQSGNIKYAFWSPDYKTRVDAKVLLKKALELKTAKNK